MLQKNTETKNRYTAVAKFWYTEGRSWALGLMGA
jgi:hypothetical protein